MSYAAAARAAVAVCAFLIALPSAEGQSSGTRAVIVDTDAGPDDLMAIAYLLARQDVRIEAVSIADGVAHLASGARNVLRLLQLGGRPDVPVYVGRVPTGPRTHRFPDAWRKNADELPGVNLPVATRVPERRGAADFLAERLDDRERTVDVLALGPLTNLAAARERSKTWRAVRSVVIMGGALRVPGNLEGASAANTRAEWNFFADVNAAHRVFSTPLPLRVISLDATRNVPIDRAFVRDIQPADTTPLGRVVIEAVESNREAVDNGTYFAWDPLAALALTDPAVVTFERVAVAIRLAAPESGRLAEDARGTAVDVAIHADARRFRDLFVATLSRR